MRALDQNDWDALRGHLRDRYYGAPQSLYHLVAATVAAPAQIAGAVCSMNSEGDNTTWSVVAVAGRTIAEVKVQYGAPDYDYDSETDPRYRQQAPAKTVITACARRLTDVVSIDVADAWQTRTDRGVGYIATGALTLTFGGGAGTLTLPPQVSIYGVDEVERSNAFYRAVRQGANL